MELTESQISTIQQKLSYTVKYSETYDEVYDHIVTAIAHLPGQNIDGAVLADQIIEQDFGSYKALAAAEDDRVKQVTHSMRKKHWHNMVQFFNVPFIGFTLLLTIAAWFIVNEPFSRKCLLAFAQVISVVPLLFIIYKKLYAKYNELKYDIYKKPSLKDNYIFIAAILGESLFNLLNLGTNRVLANAGITMFIFICYSIYVLSFFMLYHDEFKMNLAR